MESASTHPSLRSFSPVSGRTLRLLNHHLKAQQDLSSVSTLLSELTKECADLDRNIEELMKMLSLAALDWTSLSDEARSMLQSHYQQLESRSTLSPDENAMMGHRQKRILGVELPLLAKEVTRIETVRFYAEITLKLEVLVGDLEDATFSIMNQTPRSNSLNFLKASNPTGIHQEKAKLLVAVKTMNQIEDVMLDLAKRQSHWTRLSMSVDSRVEKVLAILRPQVLSNHRTLLVSLGWPPPLSKSNTERGKYLDIPNPLVLMQGEKKEKYCQSFLELCALQRLHERRTARQHNGLRNKNDYKLSESLDFDKRLCFKHGLWSIDELVKPIASRMEHHFSHWFEEPKFIFALVYKTTQDFLNGVDDVLQPLIDKAALVGCSAKEAWVSAMVKTLSSYLKTHVFPDLAMKYKDRAEDVFVHSAWLHLVDLVINFDKRVLVLATSGTPLMGLLPHAEGLSQSLLLFSIFDEHPDWLQIWAEVELKDAQHKLSFELEDEKNWLIDVTQEDRLTCEIEVETFLLSTREDYKAPIIADSVIRISWEMMEKGRSLPSKSLGIQFIRSSATLFLNHFFIVLLQRSQDMEFVIAVLEDDTLLTAVGSINAARYCESVLQEWTEDISILEMAAVDQNSNDSFFTDEIMFLVKLETDCLVEIVSALLLQFDAVTSDYIHGIEYWASEPTESKDEIPEDRILSVSPLFVEALDMLRDRLKILRLNLNSKDFVDLWRSIAGGLDHFIFSSIPLGRAKFSRHGVEQFEADARALFFVFKPFCVRPEAFFPCTSDSLKLLAMDQKSVDYLLKILSRGERLEERLKAKGLLHVSVAQAEKVLRNRKF